MTGLVMRNDQPKFCRDNNFTSLAEVAVDAVHERIQKRHFFELGVLCPVH